MEDFDKLKNKFQSGNNKKFKNYTGNVVYCVKNKKNLNKSKVYCLTSYKGNFDIDINGNVVWHNGMFLDGVLFGRIQNCDFFNGLKIEDNI